MESPVSTVMSQPLRLPNQQGWGVTLVQKKDIDGQLQHHGNPSEILRPSPSRAAHNKGTAHDGTDGWAAYEGNGITHHSNSTVLGRPNIP